MEKEKIEFDNAGEIHYSDLESKVRARLDEVAPSTYEYELKITDMKSDVGKRVVSAFFFGHQNIYSLRQNMISTVIENRSSLIVHISAFLPFV